MDLIIVTITAITALASIAGGFYFDLTQVISLGVFLYWFGGAINLMCSCIWLAGTLCSFTIKDWGDPYEKFLRPTVPLKRVVHLSVRALNLTGVVILIMHDFVYLSSFYAASTVIVIVLHWLCIECMKSAKERCESGEEV